MTANTHIRTIIRNFVDGYMTAMQDLYDEYNFDAEEPSKTVDFNQAIEACKKRYSHNTEFFATELQAIEDYAKEVIKEEDFELPQNLRQF